MNSIKPFLPSPLYVVLIVLSGFLNLFWAAVFFLGSKESATHLVQKEGLFKIFALRFMGFFVFGCVITLAIMLLSALVELLKKHKNWHTLKLVVTTSLIFHSLCALVGSLIFTLNMP